MKVVELLGYVPLLLLGFMRTPKLQLGSRDDEATALREWKLSRSHVLRGNAVPDALRLVFVQCAFECDSRRSAPYLHSHAARGNEEKERG
jgi:hypothetical protein